MEESKKYIEELEMNIKTIENKYLPDCEKIYDESERQLKINALSSIIGLKSEIWNSRAKIENIEHAIRRYDELKELEKEVQ